MFFYKFILSYFCLIRYNLGMKCKCLCKLLERKPTNNISAYTVCVPSIYMYTTFVFEYNKVCCYQLATNILDRTDCSSNRPFLLSVSSMMVLKKVVCRAKPKCSICLSINPYSAGFEFSRQNLTSVDVRF